MRPTHHSHEPFAKGVREDFLMIPSVRKCSPRAFASQTDFVIWLLEGQKMVCLLRDPLSAASQRQGRLEGVTLAFIVVALGDGQNYTKVI